MIPPFANHNSDAPAIIDAATSRTVGYGELHERVGCCAGYLKKHQGLVLFHYAENTIDSIVIYLSCLEAHVPVCLLDPRTGLSGQQLERYGPSLLTLPHNVLAPPGYDRVPLPGSPSYDLLCTAPRNSTTCHPDLALMLQTSGSTGSPKLVRLSQRNIWANAKAIATYLGLSPNERCIQSLPMTYSYGLSLIHSHLLAGGTIVLTKHSFMRPEFWEDFDRTSCTSFAGVPYMYETLVRLNFDLSRHVTLRSMTQAGGALKPELIERFRQATEKAGARLWIMYGQTEATARIAYVPPELLARKVGAIGIAIPGGKLDLAPVEANPEATELVYCGPNVMLGYAESADALAEGDNLNGILHTGDLARVDEEGYFYLTGRLRRLAKLFGRRINLEEVESHVESIYPVRAAAVCADDHCVVFVEPASDLNHVAIKETIAHYLHTTPAAITVKLVDLLPRTSSGKTDYTVLAL